ncbi:MAG: arylsulfatase, partial [Actinomycetes bacterium]
HYGGTRDGMIVHWGSGIEARGEVRHQWHHVIDVLPTVLDVTDLPEPAYVNGFAQQPIEGVSMRYSFDDADAPDRRTTQYFEMVGNRGIYHEGWTAVTRHGVPWQMVPDGERPFDADVWELYDTTTDWTQAHDLAAEQPEKLRELQELFVVEAEKYNVFPLDDRVTERENPELAGRLDLHHGRRSIELGPGAGRLSEDAAPNVKNRSHVITVGIEVADSAEGVLVAQGGRFGGWSLYCHDGVLTYAYNCYGRDRTYVRGARPLTPGTHQVVIRFAYDGGPPGSGGDVRLDVDGEQVGEGRVEGTTAYYFSFDETLNVGVDRGTPVSEEYAPGANAFTGTIRRVHFALDTDGSKLTNAERLRTRLAHH